jgi:hypothetical protein
VIGLLYSSPTFDFTSRNNHCVENLPKLLLPRRLQQITRIFYSWDTGTKFPRLQEDKPDYFTQVWLDTWENLAQMEGLEYVRVEIVFGEPAVWMDMKERLLESMKQVRGRGIKHFEVQGLPFDVPAHDD